MPEKPNRPERQVPRIQWDPDDGTDLGDRATRKERRRGERKANKQTLKDILNDSDALDEYMDDLET